ncbi:CobW family GTP-binding protein [Anaerocolumna sp. MB42-C2]|uniref:CobW family GTP-binding protein n=1 Tax=Anaerocolumna sp. MB42-C2 TaxID=3070997 RepID=UPI0027E06DE9|nr:GTP-binding protein [Anaerocolumna sp. MB42-C2]WMJ88025.1 GTP-binding protein [Anaerocolumna sp. MB42-C2]
MIKIDIISGFLGAGKTTLIKKLLEETFEGEKLALVENEFGEVGIDGAILKEYGIEIREMNSGCICCTISGDFSLALKEILKLHHPDRIIIEPSGVGKLSDVINGCKPFLKEGIVELNICMTVIDGMKYKIYMKNFTEFYKNQLINARTIILSRSQNMEPEAIEYIIHDIKKYNSKALIITTDWNQINGKTIIGLAENEEENNLESKILKELNFSKQRLNAPKKIISAKMQLDKNQEHHHADEIFSVWGKQTAKVFNFEKLKEILNGLQNTQGTVLRAKGIIRIEDNSWIQFDYVPGESNIKETVPDFTGRICVIGEDINETELSGLFGL